MIDGFTHLELIEIMLDQADNNVPDYEYDAANEFDMRLDFYGDDVSAETNQDMGECECGQAYVIHSRMDHDADTGECWTCSDRDLDSMTDSELIAYVSAETNQEVGA